jgi:hypothetical protein
MSDLNENLLNSGQDNTWHENAAQVVVRTKDLVCIRVECEQLGNQKARSRARMDRKLELLDTRIELVDRY